MARDKMSRREELFVKAYVGEAKGCGAEAARIAGYADPISSAKRILKRKFVVEAIRKFDETDTSIADPREIRQWWTEAMRYGYTHSIINGKRIEVPVRVETRVKIAEDLARSHGMFLDRAIVHHDVGPAVEELLQALAERRQQLVDVELVKALDEGDEDDR